MERWISGASTAAVLADRPQQLLGWAEERQAPAPQTPQPRADSAASCTSAVSSEVNEKARASMRVRLTVRTSESRSLHSARPIVRSGKSLSSMPNGPSSSMPTWSSPGRGRRSRGP